MNTKSRLIIAIVAVTAFLVFVSETAYRHFYSTFPWSVDKFHTVKYQASLDFFNPEIMSILILATGFFVLLTVLVFMRDRPAPVTGSGRDGVWIVVMTVLAVITNVIPFYLLVTYGKP